MGKTVNSYLLRLGDKTNEWDSKYLGVTPEEFSLYIYQDQELKKYLIRLFELNNIIIHTIKLQRFNQKLNIFISYYKKVKNILYISYSKKNKRMYLKSFKKPLFSPFYKSPLKIFYNTKIKNNFNYLPKLKKKIFYKSIDLSFKINNILNWLKPVLIHNYYNYIRKKKSINYLIKLKSKIIKFFLKKQISIKRVKIQIIRNERNLANFLKKLTKSLKKNFINKMEIFFVVKNIFRDSSFKSIKSMKNRKKLLNKIFSNLFRHKKLPFFYDSVNILFIVITKKNSAKLLSKFLAIQIKQLKRHAFFLRYIKRAVSCFIDLPNSKIKGAKIWIQGRINRKLRARGILTVIGKLPLHTFKAKINYSQSVAYTTKGTLGIKVWLCENFIESIKTLSF